MSKLLQKAFDRARTLPESRQDEVAEMVLALVDQEHSDLRLTPEQVDEVRRRLASAESPVSAEDARVFLEKLN